MLHQELKEWQSLSVTVMSCLKHLIFIFLAQIFKQLSQHSLVQATQNQIYFFSGTTTIASVSLLLEWTNTKLKAEDMTGYDITKVQDYASFMAIHANNQGNGSEGALKRFNEIVVKGRRETASDKLWSAFCSGVKP